VEAALDADDYLDELDRASATAEGTPATAESDD
jgi:hypothetical protein